MESKWSNELVESTKRILNEVIVENFSYQNRCQMKRSGGNHFFKFGYITLEDAMNEIYKIQDNCSSSFVSYTTLEELLENGWVVD